MNKIFRYELRRLLWNKLFFGILLVSLGYGWLTLTGSVVRGVAHTAPFSPWSFGYYLSQALPLICLGELFFLAFFFSREERLLRPLTQATPIRQRRYAALRCGAVLTATLVLCLCVAVWVGGLWGTDFTRSIDPDPAHCLLPGSRNDVEPLQPYSDLRSYGGSNFIDCAAPAPGNQFFVERFLLSISVDG